MHVRLKGLALLILVLTGAYVAHRTGLAEKLRPDEMKTFLRSFGVWAPAVFIAVASMRPLLFVPAGLISVVGGLVFGSLVGTVYTLVGSTIGALIAFEIARYFGRELVQKVSKGRLEGWGKMLEGQGIHIIFLTRLMPVFPFDAISYAAGLSSISFRNFFVGTMLGIIPGTFVYSFLGSTLHEGLTPRFIGAVALTVGLAMIPTGYKLYQTKLKRR